MMLEDILFAFFFSTYRISSDPQMAAMIPRRLFIASARSNGCKSVRSTYASNSEMFLSGVLISYYFFDIGVCVGRRRW
jgi:hypothetical protein